MPLFSLMTYFDFAIIYLSLGAPLGVYSFLQLKGSSIRPTDVARAVASVVIWPVYGLTLLYPSFRSIFVSNTFVYDGDTDSVAFTKTQNALTGLKDALITFPRAEAAENFAVAERFAELSLIRSYSKTKVSPQFHDLLAAAGHPDPRIGAKCLERRNQQNVLKHQRNARTDVVELSDRLTIEQEVVRKALFDLLDLHSSANNEAGVQAASFKGEKWKTIEVPSLENAMNTKS